MTERRAARVHATIERLNQIGKVIDAAGKNRDLFPLAIPPEEGDALCTWVARERVKNTIEVGFAYAIATLCIAEGLLRGGATDPHHVAIDPFQGTSFANLGRRHLEDAGVADLVTIHEDESQLVLPRLLGEGRAAMYDFAFVDGNHRFDRVFLDLVYLGRLLRPGSIVFLDDHQLPAIVRAVEFFTSNRGWKLEERSRPDPQREWLIVRTADPPDDRGFADFVDFAPRRSTVHRVT